MSAQRLMFNVSGCGAKGRQRDKALHNIPGDGSGDGDEGEEARGRKRSGRDGYRRTGTAGSPR